MAARFRYYVKKTLQYASSCVIWAVIDSDTGKQVFDSIFESRCHAQARKFNQQLRAYPGGQNKRHK